ncbi:MAG: hypothetical protein R3F56_10705 [Planctomycetota bacterium]
MRQETRTLASRALLLLGASALGFSARQLWKQPVPPVQGMPLQQPVPPLVTTGAAPPATAGAALPAPDARPVLPQHRRRGSPAASPPTLVVCGDLDGLRHLHALFARLARAPRLQPMAGAESLKLVRCKTAHAAVVCARPGSPPAAAGLIVRSLGLFAPVLVAAPSSPRRDLTRRELEALCRGPARAAAACDRSQGAPLVGVPPPRTTDWPRLRLTRLELLADPQRIWQRVCTDGEPTLGLLSLATLPRGAPAVCVDGVVPDAGSVRARHYPYGYEVYLVHAGADDASLDAFLRLLASAPGQAILRRDLVP